MDVGSCRRRMLDIATLAAAMSRPEADRAKIGRAIAMVLGVTALDVYCAKNLTDKSNGRLLVKTKRNSRNSSNHHQQVAGRGLCVLAQFRKSASFHGTPGSCAHVRRPPLPLDRERPGGTTAEWDAEVVDDIPGRMIAWRSLEGAEVDNSGSVRFERAAGGRGTVVNVELRYNPPAGAFGAMFAKLFGQDPGQQIAHDLRSLKQILEIGEAVNSDASIPTACIRHSSGQPVRRTDT